MSHVVNTSSALEGVDLSDYDECIKHGLSGKKALMDSARGFVTHHGPIEKWIEEMGLATSTGYRYQAALLKEGTFKYLQPKQPSSHPAAVKARNHRAKVANSPSEKMQPAPIVQKLEPQDELRTIEYTSLAPAPMRHLEPGEHTSDLYNSLLPHLDFLYQQIVLGRPDFTAEEWCSIAGSLRGLTHAVQPKIDHLKAVERDRVESISVNAAEAS